MKGKILKSVHDIRGALSVVVGFIKFMDKSQMSQDGLALYEAAKISLNKIEACLDDLQKIAEDEEHL